jgi:predicted alpha/beta-hydrolase family hydrolase
MLAASDATLVDALLHLSYPLHPPKRPSELRTTHFPTLHTPALFVHGTRDAFATNEELAAALKLIPARTELLSIEDAGHELMTSRNRSYLLEAIPAVFAAFSSGALPTLSIAPNAAL